ncbi:hypothetical protein DVH24_034922 [Malus domestica]|uniref:Uncharacterized protein n=1 Tax=Malus domestica TaxID=3750 RepID=A0A498IJ45_MALDO|nr:hypothetical protein DVH24_034922 [Malus domestica]
MSCNSYCWNRKRKYILMNNGVLPLGNPYSCLHRALFHLHHSVLFLLPSSFAGNIISSAPPRINNNISDHLFPSHGCREENHAVGIDLGTTHSRVAVWHKDHVEIILNDQGNRKTPSYVAFSETDERLVGDQAFNQVVRNSANSIYGT